MQLRAWPTVGRGRQRAESGHLPQGKLLACSRFGFDSFYILCHEHASTLLLATVRSGRPALDEETIGVCFAQEPDCSLDPRSGSM